MTKSSTTDQTEDQAAEDAKPETDDAAAAESAAATASARRSFVYGMVIGLLLGVMTVRAVALQVHPVPKPLLQASVEIPPPSAMLTPEEIISKLDRSVRNPEEQAKLLDELVAERLTTRQFPPLVRAAVNCDPTLAKELIAQGQNVELKDAQGDTALAWAAKRNCLPLVQMLLTAGANANATADNDITPTRWAEMYNHKEVLANLQRAGGRTTAPK